MDKPEKREISHGLSLEKNNMVTAAKQDCQSSIPLSSLPVHKKSNRAANRHVRPSSGAAQPSTSLYHHQSQMTPPTTPNGSQEALLQQPRPLFSNFLRAFYPFHPNYDNSDNTVTLPLNEGDVVMVHSIHHNGWADGTLLLSGARGWLPTNYCNPYEPEWMRNLLNALLNFSGVFSQASFATHEMTGNQEFIRGMIAGVRYLLEKTDCLTRESPMVSSHEGLRRHRKALLSDLSTLVKIAKRLGELASQHSKAVEDELHERIEEIVVKAFKIVTRAVHFLDVYVDLKAVESFNEQPLTTTKFASPPTPPADSTSFGGEPSHLQNVAETIPETIPETSVLETIPETIPETSVPETSSERIPNDSVSPYKGQSPARHGAVMNSKASPRSNSTKRRSNRLSVSHRLSLAAPMLAAQREKLASFKVESAHEALISHLGSFVGCLKQAQHSVTLAHHIDQALTSGRELLVAVDAVCAYDGPAADSIERARQALADKFDILQQAAHEILQPVYLDDEDMMMPGEHRRLLEAATNCVSAAGACVTRTKAVFERIGDFEFDPASDDADAADGSEDVRVTVDTTTASASSGRRQLPALTIETSEKPLPRVPSSSSGETRIDTGASRFSATSSRSSSARQSLLPPLPKPSGLFSAEEEYSPSEGSPATDSEYHGAYRIHSIAVSSTGSRSTAYLSNARDSETSMLSDTSTRATTPDIGSYHSRHKSSLSASTSYASSHLTAADDPDDMESGLLTKTFAHELMYNKDGQITGGSLPALVERLTTHDSTPDATFVSAFYITFRLFVTPRALVAALVDRFDYVGEDHSVAGPVRLRVYNIFKGWLETHWRGLSDHDALPAIQWFAKEKLSAVIPAAGKRLLELTGKVSSTDGQLVPRLVSSLGKTSTANSQYISPDTPMPPPLMTRSQMQLLKSWKSGGNMPSLMDFDPLEVARQLTLKDMKIFCSIMPDELLASEWMKKSGSKAVNVRAMSTLSTDLSNLVADTILHHDDVKKRAGVIKQWIKIASKCLELNNYDSLMAILCSLNSSTILRLRKTWDAVPQKKKDVLKELQDIVQPTRNHAVLRQRLQNHVPPCLPFVGTYLTDLTFVDIGNAATKQLPGSDEDSGMRVINFDKHTRTAKLIGDLQRFQIPYRLVEVPELQEWLQAQLVRVKSSDSANVQQYYRKSLKLEPREATARASPIDPQTGFPMSQPVPIKPNFFGGWAHPSKATAP